VITVVDASVAIKWFLSFKPEEDYAGHALKILEEAVAGRLKLHQPPHFVAEMAAVLARVNPQNALLDLRDLLNLDFHRVEDSELYAVATDLAMRLDHHAFDTLYHAVALLTPGADLITADRRYYEKARREGQIILLAAWSPTA
jgi:predicted nucleic acid-binding protein